MNLRRLLSFILSAFIVLSTWTSTVLADVVTYGRLQLSTHVASVGANHTFLFVTPSGVDANTDTITVRYQSGFDLTSLSAPADMDLGVDGDSACDGSFTEKTLAASPAAGVWGVGVSGQDITFTAPSDAASGEIAAGRCVRIRIGTNAVTGSTGTHQIVNPGSATAYEVDVLGTFSDHGMFSVAIATSGSISVTASVPNGSSTPSPSPTPVGDTSAPIISNVSVLSSDTQAIVTWITDEPASSEVEYGVSTSYGANITDTLFRTEHTQIIGGLTQDTEYHLRIQATDSSGNRGQSADIVFTTLDVVPPEIQNLTLISVTETTATLTWDVTDTVDAWVSNARSRDALWISSSPAATFTATITGLTPNTVYNETLHAVDNGNLEDTEAITFTTLGDVPPGNVTDLTLLPDIDQITLSWRNPIDADLVSIVIRSSTVSYPLSPSQGSGVIDSLVKEAMHVSLTEDTLYFYTVFARDASGQYSSGTLISGRTLALPIDPPKPEVPEEEFVEDTVPTPPISTPVTPSPTAPSVPLPLTPVLPGMPSVEREDETVSSPLPTPLVPEPIVDQPATQANAYRLSSDLVEFRVANQTITLSVSPESNTVHVLGGRSITLVLLPSAWTETVVSAEVLVGGDSYLVQPSASFITPLTSGSMTLVVRFTDGTIRTLAFHFLVVPDGSLVQSADMGTQEVGGVVTLFSGSAQWNALAFAQRNPLVVSAGEGVAWYAPQGSYRVRAEGPNGLVQEQSLTITDSIIAPRLILTEGAETSVITEESATASVFTNAEQQLDLLRTTSAAQAVVVISTPIATIAAVATVSTLATSFSLLSYLRYLLSAPLLLYRRKKRSQWGMVYDSLRKVPVDLALVRLLDAKTGRVIKSQVTDKLGRYFFLVGPGTYRLAIQKAKFSFPSSLITEKTDGDILDVYRGESIEVQAQGITIAVNVPLDTMEQKDAHEPKSIQRRRWFRRFQFIVAVSGMVLAAIALFLQPSPFAWSMLGVQVLAFALFARLAKVPKPKGWGMVYDTKTKKPLARAIVRIFEPKFHKLLETQITDARGHYAFLVGPNTYYATYQHAQYEDAELNPIDYRGKKEPGFVSESIGLAPKQS